MCVCLCKYVINCRLKKNAQHKSCELSFIWGKMRMQPRRQHLRSCSAKRQWGKVSIYVILVKGKYMQSGTFYSRRFLLVWGSFASHKEQLPP